MFKCDKCGQCCRYLDKSEIYKELDRGDGVCIYLVGNLCGIYEDRPLICRVDEAYYAFFGGLMTKQEYYRLNYHACDKLKNKEE